MKTELEAAANRDEDTQLTDAQVAEIRSRTSQSDSVLAREYGVDKDTIRKVRRRRSNKLETAEERRQRLLKASPLLRRAVAQGKTI